MKNFIQLIKIEFKRIFANNVLLAIFFGAPVLYGFLLGHVYQQAKVINLPILIIDQDQSPMTDRIIDAFEDNETLFVTDVRPIASNLVEEMPKKEYTAVVTFPNDFEAKVLQKRHPEVRVDLNMVNILNANTASKNIQQVLMTINAGIEIEGLKKQGMHPSQAMDSYESFKINFNKLYNSTGNYVTFMLPGLMGVIMQQIIFLAMALVFARDFEDGYFKTLVQKSRSSLYIAFVKIVPFIILTPIVWLVVSFFFSYYKIDADIYNLPMYVLVLLLTTSCMFVGMLFSVIIPSQLKATELLMVISTPAFILSGFTWPTIAIPTTITQVSQFIPLTQFLKGFRKIAFYDGTFNSISHEIKMLSLISVVSFLLMLTILQVKIYWAQKRLKSETEHI